MNTDPSKNLMIKLQLGLHNFDLGCFKYWRFAAANTANSLTDDNKTFSLFISHFFSFKKYFVVTSLSILLSLCSDIKVANFKKFANF